MNGDEQLAVDALRLLRGAVDEVMAEKGIEDEEAVVGVPIALRQGDLSSARYAAIEALLEAGALMRDPETDEANELLSNVLGVPEVFKITSDGLDYAGRGRWGCERARYSSMNTAIHPPSGKARSVLKNSFVPFSERSSGA
jgi:hypothetical protein